jgi:hypothetical protein
MNLSRIIERHAQFTPQQVALHGDGEDISYLQLWQRIRPSCHGRTAVARCGAG